MCATLIDNAIRNCSYRYIDGRKKVYTIGRNPKEVQYRHFYKVELYTRPLYNPNKKDVRNALVAFNSQSQGENVVAELLSRTDLPDTRASHDLIVEGIKLDDLKYLSSVLKMPLIVLMNSFCNVEDQDVHHEVFYYFNESKFGKNKK